MSLRDLNPDTNYFSAEDDILNSFYIPVLKETKYYDRMASFFSSSSITGASLGFKNIIENNGHVRLLVNTELDEKDVDVLKGERETPTENIKKLLDPKTAKNKEQKIRWQILGWMLDNDYLEIKICDVSRGGLFHPKVGILEDEQGNTVVFSGSVNESKQAWERNIEDIDVFSSWKVGHQNFMDPKIRHFEELWKDDLEITKTYDVPEAIKKDIIKTRPSDYQRLKERSKRLPEEDTKELTTDDWVKIVSDAGKTVGGTHIAEVASSIEPWPHQRIISDTLYAAYPKGFLLCDEVGLGKTIEAGLTLSRLINTKEIQNALILAPANLLKQWQEELYEKFNLHTYRYMKPTSEHEYKMVGPRGKVKDIPDLNNEYAWSDSPVWRFVHQENKEGEKAIILASWHLARMQENQEDFVPDNEEKGKVRDQSMVEASCRGRNKEDREGVWDIVFVDEAHKARRRKFRTAQQREGNYLLKLLRRLKSYTQCMHLLTATPMQIHSIELYDLLSLVGIPEEWNNPNNFLDFYNTRKALQTVLDNKKQKHTGQTKFKDGKQIKQSKLNAKDFLGDIGRQLGTDREETINYLLRASKLLRAYDNAQNGVYTDELENKISRSENRNYLQYLIRDEDQYIGISSRKERKNALEHLSIGDWEVVLEAFNEAHPIDVILNRYTRDTLRDYRARGLLDQNVPNRDVSKRMIELGDATSVYENIENYVRNFYKKGMEGDDERSRSVGLVMTTYRQRMTSSFRAIRKSLTNRLDQLTKAKEELEKGEITKKKEYQSPTEIGNKSKISSDDVEDFVDSTEEAEMDSFDLESFFDMDISEDVEKYTALLDEEIKELESFISDVKDLRGHQDPKLEKLRKDIQEVNRKGRDRVMVFTQFTDTLDAIRDSLISNYGKQVGCYSGRGGEMYINGSWKEVGKEKVKNEFNSDHGDVEILVCTEAASQGLNLQRCGVLINYDLPWNPMRVEQRIGRIDRIGQEYEDVWIYNYFYENTVETDIYKKLEDRVNIFHEYVGGMQPILSTVSDQILKAAMESKSSELKEAKTDESYEYISSEIDTVEKDRLNGWDDYEHPDIGEIEVGASYPYQTPVKNDKIKEMMLNSQILEDEDIKISLFSGVDEEVYRIEISNEKEKELNYLSEIWEKPEEDTLADKIVEHSEETYEFAVTFETDVFQQYPSLRLMSFGDELFGRLIRFLDEKSKMSNLISQFCLDRDGNEIKNGNWMVCG
ncbi:MAG: helicase-related protein, partial [Thermoplasmatota archaeon]